jgi:putative flippase GtrA
VRQFLRFGMVGALCAALTLGTFAVLHSAGVHYVLAGVLAYAAGIALGFRLNRTWTFRAHHGSARRQAIRFLAVSALGISLNALLLRLFVEAGGLAEFPAEVVTVACVSPVTFTANRLWAFR